MVIGNGQLAKAFVGFEKHDVIIFASGVSNSYMTDRKEFLREKKLLLSVLKNNKHKPFVYFSSCALSSPDYPMNAYYIHKLAMEALIKVYTKRYYIFRIPQLFGDLKEHPTLINFFYHAIKNEKPFILYKGAYRYVIDIDDIFLLVQQYLDLHVEGLVVDLSNTYKYSVEEIVLTLEELMDKKSIYKESQIIDDYHLSLEPLETFIQNYQLNLNFGRSYLHDKLKARIPFF